jgi:hypothetical protein
MTKTIRQHHHHFVFETVPWNEMIVALVVTKFAAQGSIVMMSLFYHHQWLSPVSEWIYLVMDFLLLVDHVSEETVYLVWDGQENFEKYHHCLTIQHLLASNFRNFQQRRNLKIRHPHFEGNDVSLPEMKLNLLLLEIFSFCEVQFLGRAVLNLSFNSDDNDAYFRNYPNNFMNKQLLEKAHL